MIGRARSCRDPGRVTISKDQWVDHNAIAIARGQLQEAEKLEQGVPLAGKRTST